MRRFQAGFELGDLNEFESTSVSGSGYSVSNTTSAVRTGSNGFRATIAAVAGNAYGTVTFGTATQKWYNVFQGTANTAHPLINTAASAGFESYRCFARFHVRFSASGAFNFIDVMKLGSASTWYVAVRISGSARNIALLTPNNSDSVTLGALALNTWYRVEVGLEQNANGTQGWTWCRVYTSATNTLLYQAGLDQAIGVNQITKFVLGAWPAATPNAAANFDFDDVAINDNNDYSGAGGNVHSSIAGSGQCQGITQVNGDDGTVLALQPSTAGTHYTLVDETSLDTSDYTNSLTSDGANTDDAYDITNFSAGGSEVVKSVMMRVAYGEIASGLNVWHAAGFYDNSTRFYTWFPAAMGPTYHYRIMDEQDDNSATDNTWANALQILVGKESDLFGLNDNKFFQVLVEYEDDEALSAVTVPDHWHLDDSPRRVMHAT